MDRRITQEIMANADYGDRPEGLLGDAEMLGLHLQVQEGLKTTNGDAGVIEVSTRQLALLLAAAAR
jgi:hypothetical protein